MSHHHDHALPKLPLYAAVGLVVATLLMVAMVRMTGIGEVKTPITAVTAERMLRFADDTDGGISVRDGHDDALIGRVDPGTNGFLRGTLRGLARERKRSGFGPAAPYRLTSRIDGRLLLEDPSTGRLVDLGAFGVTNALVFSRLLTAKPMPAPDLPLTGAVPASPVILDQSVALAARPQ
jgi:putative photosynthetic complex assembly protein